MWWQQADKQEKIGESALRCVPGALVPVALLSPAVPGLALPSCMLAHSSGLRDPAGPLGTKERENVMKFDQQNECVLQSGFPVSPVLFSEFPFTVSPFFFSFSPEHVFSFSASGFCVCPSSKALPAFFLSLEPQPFPLKCFFFFFSFFRFQDFLLYGWVFTGPISGLCVSLALGHVHIYVFQNSCSPRAHDPWGSVPFPLGLSSLLGSV